MFRINNLKVGVEKVIDETECGVCENHVMGLLILLGLAWGT